MKLTDNDKREVELVLIPPPPSPPLTRGAEGGFLKLGLVTNGASLPYNPKLVDRAKALRKNMTPSEKKMWYKVLFNKQFENLRWLRQRPIDNFIVDFYCAELKLIVEIDGDSHEDRTEYDADRTTILEGYGLTVVRFTNCDVLNNIQGVCTHLHNVVEMIKEIFAENKLIIP